MQQASSIPGNQMWNSGRKQAPPQTDIQIQPSVPLSDMLPRQRDGDQPEPEQVLPNVSGAKALQALLQPPKNIAPLQDFRNKNRLILSSALNDYFNSLEPTAHLGRSSANYLPLQHAKYIQNQQKKASLDTYLSMLEKTTRDVNNKNWKTMGAKWDDYQKVWKLPDNKAFSRKLDIDNKRKKIKSLSEYNNKLLSQQLTPEQIAQNVPNLVKQLVLSNQQISRYGFGKVSAKSLPFYGGRYLDPFTGRIKTIGMMSQKYLNPTNFRQHLLYLQSKVVAKWNNFVRAEQQYTKFSKVNPVDFTNNQVASIKNAINKDDNIKTAFNSLWKQIQLWRASLPVPQNVEIVCQQMLSFSKEKANQFFGLIEKIAKTKKGQDKTIDELRQKYVAQLEKGYGALPKPKEGASVSEVNKYAKATAAFGLWVNKGIAMTQRALKKYVRTFIPSTIEPQKIQIVAEQLKNADEKINSVFGKLSVDGEGKITGLGKLQQAQTVQEFVQSITNFKPQGAKARVIPLFMRGEKRKVAGKLYPTEIKLKY